MQQAMSEEISEPATAILSEEALTGTDTCLEERLRSLLRLKQKFAESLRGGALAEDAFALATFNLMRGGCRITGADGASLYSSKREGYLDRLAFCSDLGLTFEQIRSASQASEHVAVGRGIAGFLALDSEARERRAYRLKYPIRESAITEVWDIPAIQDLPSGLRFKTTRLQTDGAIDISSMMLIKSIGANGTDMILQLVRRTANGMFTTEEKLLALLFAELIFPYFRELESAQKKESPAAAAPGAQTNPIQQIATEAIQAIQAIAHAAMDGSKATSQKPFA